MPVCTGCKLPKSDDQFHWRSRKLGVRIRRCRSCASVWSKDHYKRNKPSYLKKAKTWTAKHRATLQRHVADHLRAHPCVDCGETDLVVLQFDHVTGIKIAAIAQMVVDVWPLEDLRAEIAKCVVRCANCHVRKTAKDFGHWKLATIV